MDKQKYEKNGSAGSKRSHFQVHLLVVSLLKALRMRLPNWRLSTEDKRAGKFDDVVLEWSEGAVLLQAKHKENMKRITVEQLMSTTSKNDFSIPKYFLSYQEIKEKFPTLREAVICTNGSANERALEFLNSQTDSSDSVLFCESGATLLYTLDDDILPKLKEKIKTYYSQNPRGIKVDESVITDENLKTFQKHFRIYFDYPSGSALKDVVAKLLNRTGWCAKVSASEIYSKVMDWFHQIDGEFFTELRTRVMVSEIRTEKYWQSLMKYDVCFAHNDLNFADLNRRYYFITDGSYLLQEIRILQALRSTKQKALYIHPNDSVEDQNQLIEAFALPHYIILIIVQPRESVTAELWDKIQEILNQYARKKVVLLTARDNKLVRVIQSGNNSFDLTKETPTYDDFLKETRDRLLNVRNVLFQGKSISMKDLFIPESIGSYKTSLGSEILERLVTGETIRVRSGLQVLEEGVGHFYIPRRFIRNNEKRLQDNIFEANDKLILISDSAGTGKTTALAKLAMLIKETNPHLSVIKIVLDQYSKFLKDSLRKHKTMLDVMEFLNSQEATKLTNELDEHVFSIKNKVVLMLDGVDEISPFYTKLVEGLLDNCLKAPNIFKIFATTRPHVAEKLEERFQVKSFVLEPFSEMNQIDFLSSYWLHNLGYANREKCEQYARALVKKMFAWTKSNFRRHNDFAAIPLQIKMVAEIFQENERNTRVGEWEGCKEFVNSDRQVPRLPEKIDLARLYKLFIEKKRDVFIDKLNPSGCAETEHMLLNQFNENLVFHRTYALKIIIYEKTMLNLFTCYKMEKNCVARALKIGIMQEIDNRLQFIHRTFAEFFVAECLLMELKRHNQKPEFHKFLIDHILFETQFSVICGVFDSLLQNCVNTLPRDIFQNYLRFSYDIDSFYPAHFCLVHDLALIGFLAIIRFLLKCVDFKIIEFNETSIGEILPKKDITLKQHYFGNRLTILQRHVKKGGINIRDWLGRTPLYIASREGHLEMVKFFIEQGANVIQGGSELYEAISNNHAHVAHYLLDKIIEGVSLERRLDTEYAMIPFAAAYLGRIDILNFLVERGMSVNTRIRNQQSLLFGAAMGGQLEATKYLVRKNADINSRDNDNNTVLHLVSQSSSLISIGKYLVELKIDIDARNKNGMTALHVAVDDGVCDMAELLIRSGADVNSMKKFGRNSIIYTAALKNHLAIVELLAEHGADVNVKNIDGDTLLLHLFTEFGRVDVIKCLVKSGADVTVKDKTGRTALHVAISERQNDIAKYLIECSNIDVNSIDNDGQTILHLCISLKVSLDDHFSSHSFALQRLDIIKRLVSRGANLNIPNGKSQMVLYSAA